MHILTRFLSFFLSSFLLSFFLCPLCRHCRRSRPLSPCPPVAAVLLSLCPHRVRTRIGVSSHPCAESDVPRTTKYKVGLIYRVTDVVVAHSLDTVGGGASHVVPMSPLDKTKNNTEQRRGQWLSHADSNRTERTGCPGSGSSRDRKSSQYQAATRMERHAHVSKG